MDKCRTFPNNLNHVFKNNDKKIKFKTYNHTHYVCF